MLSEESHGIPAALSKPLLTNQRRKAVHQHVERYYDGPPRPSPLQVTQIRIAGEPSYDTRYAFIEFSTPEEVSCLPCYRTESLVQSVQPAC